MPNGPCGRSEPDGRARRTNGTVTVELGSSDGVTFETTDNVTDGPVSVSIRPEDIDLADGDGPIEGEVTERYFQGDQTQYVVDPLDDNLDEFRAVMQGRNTPIRTGDTAAFTIVDGGPAVFDRE